MPREKVGPKGARIRCSRCQSVFVVRPDSGQGAERAPAAAPPRPELTPPSAAPALSGTQGGSSAPPLHVPSDDPFAPRPDAQPAPWQAQPVVAPSAPPPPAQVDAFASVEPPRDPFAPVAPPGDPFAPAPPVNGTDKPAIPAPAAAGTPWDPFGVTAAAAADEAVPLSPPRAQRSAPELEELLAGSVGAPAPAAAPAPEPGPLALEEREPPPPLQPRPSLASFDEPAPELDLGSSAFAQGPLDDLDLATGRAPSSEPDVAPPGTVDPPWAADSAPPPPPAAGPVDGPASAPGAPAAAPVAAASTPAHASSVPAAPLADTLAASRASSEADPAPPADAAAARLKARRLAALTNSLSLALLVALAVGLFLAWRAGLASRLEGALARSAPLVSASEVTGGLYDTSSGVAVLVVRGQVAARADVSGPVRVQVQLVEDGRVVGDELGLAGSTATPEDVYGAGTPATAAALRRELDRRAARTLKAGQAAPFLVVFSPPVPDPRRLELRVTAGPAIP